MILWRRGQFRKIYKAAPAHSRRSHITTLRYDRSVYDVIGCLNTKAHIYVSAVCACICAASTGTTAPTSAGSLGSLAQYRQRFESSLELSVVIVYLFS